MVDKALRLCVQEVYKSTSVGASATGTGTTVAGRIEGGFLMPMTRVRACPGADIGSATKIAINGAPVPFAVAGDNVDVAIGGLDEHSLRPGQILTWPSHPIRPVTKFKAQIAILPTFDIPIVAGQQFTLHTHIVEEPCNITRLLRTLDKEGHTADIKPRCLLKGSVAVVRIKLARPVCLETFAEHPRLGRFMLRYGGYTVAAGMVQKITR